MRLLWVLKLAVFLCLNTVSFATDSNNLIPEKDFENKNYFVIELKNNSFIDSVLKLHPNWNYEYQIQTLNSFHVFSLPINDSDFHWINKLHVLDDIIEDPFDYKIVKREQFEFIDNLQKNEVRGIHSLHKKKLEKRLPVPIDDYDNKLSSIFSKRKQDSTIDNILHIAEEFQINDPIFKDQWHIINPAYPGHDVNVVPVWRMNITGKGVVTALVDDGLDYDSLDLKDNYSPEGSWDYNDKRPNPKPMLTSDYHGTRCAAEIAAKKGNNYCGVGVAFDSKVSGIRILSAEITSEDEAAAMYYALDINDIYSCSWGPPDNGRSMDSPDKLVRAGMMKGILDGRNGKGALYVFASGNGGSRGDTCNFDGYTNSIYSLTVTALDHKGLHPSYAESCTAVMVTTYSSGSGEHIHTTDINDQCTTVHGGTSAAAPLAAGIYALILEANPDLTWRDVQYLTVLSAGEVDPFDSSWQDTAIEGRKYSPKYGWGITDAEKMVKMAMNDWKLLKPQSWYYMPRKSPNLSLNEIGEVQDSYNVTSEILEKANFETIEQITITVDIKSGKRGNVEVDLISPNGIKSNLAISRNHDNDQLGFRKWTFSTVAHWGEKAEGEWTLKVRNTGETNSVIFKRWQLKFFGECINPDLAKRFDMDEDYSKINGELEGEDNENNNNSTIISLISTVVDASITSATDIEKSTEAIIETSIESPTELSNSIDIITSTTEDSNKEIKTEIPVSTTDSIPSATSSAISKPGEEDGSYENKDKSKHYIGYFSIFVVAGFFIMLYIFKNRRSPGRARRREDFEFDIIRPEDDESSRFEFDDDDDEDEDDDNSNENNKNFGKANSTLNDSIFDEDAKSFNFSDSQFNSKDMRLEDSTGNSNSEFDLGNSELTGFEKTDLIIKDANKRENDETQILNAKNDKKESDEHSNLLTSDSTSDEGN